MRRMAAPSTLLLLVLAACAGSPSSVADLPDSSDVAHTDTTASDADDAPDLPLADLQGTDAVLDSACATGSWETLAPMPTPRFGCAAALLMPFPGERLVVTGGFASAYLDRGEAYDPATDTWSTLPHLAHPRSMHGSAAIAGKVHVFGGFDGSETRIDHEVFDPATGTWAAGSPMPRMRADFATATVSVVAGPRILVVGGYDGDGNPVGWTEAFDSLTGTWEMRTDMPSRRSGLALAAVGEGNQVRVFAMGGKHGATLSDVNEEYDPAKDQWFARAPLPEARQWAVAAGVNGMVYLFGGSGTSFSLDLVQAYDPLLDVWTTQSSLPTPRTMAAIAVENGRIHVIGGSGGVRDAHEVFTPSVICSGGR